MKKGQKPYVVWPVVGWLVGWLPVSVGGPLAAVGRRAVVVLLAAAEAEEPKRFPQKLQLYTISYNNLFFDIMYLLSTSSPSLLSLLWWPRRHFFLLSDFSCSESYKFKPKIL